MKDGHEARGGGDAETWSVAYDTAYDWAADCPVDQFQGRVKAIREGEEGGFPPRPATAIRALYAFALRRSIDELIASAREFDTRDAITLLATAALSRNILQAAELAIKQWDAEQDIDDDSLRLTYGVIHDIACQRTVLDVAVFIRECRRVGKQEMVDRTVGVFTAPGSGRTNLDKALLHIALRDEGCAQEAAELLRQALFSITGDSSLQASETVPREFQDLAGALHELSPSERILEEWIDDQLQLLDRVHDTRRIVSQLIATGTDRSDSLMRHVGRRRSQYDIVEICGQLAKESLTDKCEGIRRHAASRENLVQLAEIVRFWHESELLTRTTRDLLADIVAGGDRETVRSPDELDRLDTVLGNVNASPECRRLLRIAAAVHTEGRTGADLVALLGRIEGTRDRNRAAQTIAQRLAVHILEQGAGVGLFVEYVRGLRAARSGDAVYRACKELADPPDSVRQSAGSGALIAEIAAQLYDETDPELRDALHKDGWDLLERCLENEQRVTPEDVVAIVRRLCDSRLSEEDRYFLLRATVGRWSDTHRREEAVHVLRDGGFDDEAKQVIRSLR
ncbi:hypothetical protein AQJ23_12735 [Streptomyces antibioticus]|nr:hypothetical protein [Streptomyces antibioticus]KUN27578.1 hypothetical protein AQJ23_12735 [Streptomyces antibioticus]